MPIRNAWLPREGLTVDPIGRLLKRTALNPAVTLPLLLLARYTQQGRDVALSHGKLVKNINVLLALGLLQWATDFLDRGSVNNWTDDKYDWSREIVLVTGGSDGLGKLIVQLLAERGIRVVVLDVQPLTFEAPENVFYYKCDVRTQAAVTSVANEVRSRVGHPTVLVDNAGVARGTTILDATEADIRLTFDVNTLSHYWLTKEFLPDMIHNNHGMVVTVASLAGSVTAPQMVEYAASKAAAMAFHEGLASELKMRYNAPKVRTVLLTTGHIRTSLFAGWKEANGFTFPSLEPETVAEGVVKHILSGSSGNLVFPAVGRYALNLRSWPYWIQNIVRNQGDKLMRSFSGRQVSLSHTSNSGQIPGDRPQREAIMRQVRGKEQRKSGSGLPVTDHFVRRSKAASRRRLKLRM
ncbi:MAG: hypothetical protein M1837_003561 [Sclerophora amabilis]|nr:MAG: hypothetical protein M1837_003561 [Sclerophora amabilis]